MKTILIAEDDPFIRDIAEERLTHAGYIVHKVSDGEAVIQRIIELQPDLLLLDLGLPHVHGFALLEDLRNRVDFAALPVVIFSNENSSEIQERTEKLNAHYFFKASTGTGDLVEKIDSLLNT